MTDLGELLRQDSVTVAPRLLGALLTSVTADGQRVTVRLTEVEAYQGPHDSAAPDPGSHSYRGRTPRTSVMFGAPGHLYCYFTYGMHWCANVVCAPEGTSSAVLLRAGEVVEGLETAHRRRPAARKAKELASGPARLASALGLARNANGLPLRGMGLPGSGLSRGGVPTLPDDANLTVSLELQPRLAAEQLASGPRVGVSGAGGSLSYPWRFWIAGDPTVSRYVPGRTYGHQ
ncbi:DNA-3-methyladenine glycosylase [Psychromicrobium xiongbiense]|uniref:DNA-3-methyladenine glycosylase n=1 Tax=Psychromicrobium xiongbiense TaxID=3051184 RepID=UPI0025569BF9|nr:DNA-3-methyladenine glycosylase [Psychromicrobium sp. YIM S02556]